MQSSSDHPRKNSSRWKEVDALLDSILELPEHERAAYLDKECAGDDLLRKEIERLLAHDHQLGGFIETPALHGAGEQMDTSHLVSLIKGEGEPVLRTGRLVAERYQILERLGKGGMGEVWHAYDLKLRMDVALKSLRLNLHRSKESHVDLIRREVRTAREVISSHVCRIFDLVTVEDQELISMEFIDGITLLKFLEKNGPMDLPGARNIAAQFLAGLDAIHNAGLVHRDFKPENIMITRTGRVVVMDLGIAEQIAEAGTAISGTIPYMSPEQSAGQKVDARSDIFSAALVLAEMIHTRGAQDKTTRESIWKGVRANPVELPDSPWRSVLLRAIALNPDNRFESASALSRALEEVTLRTEAGEKVKPYPGLAAFRRENSEYFFGREEEIEWMIKKLRLQNLLAFIGPSGAGKTSLLQAGLIPALPQEWVCILTHPGTDAMTALTHSLTPFVQDQASFEGSDAAIQILSDLRAKHSEVLLIVDRFEELFTLNSELVQSHYAELLGRIAMEANVRVLLSMRDDFLVSCKEYFALSRIFSDLTAILPLKGTALRRALLQPALSCGYRFEDEALINEILADVEREKGGLPLLAFAASLLWERRDHETGLLTRVAYKKIGGVQGALALHAETMMAEIGSEQELVVREIFRNLITAKQTRIARDREELLSIFQKKDEISAARKVLQKLIDARLLTSFSDSSLNEISKSRVEISHESLITNWPRLAKWQMQEAESAKLRDQLRQAAQLWIDKGRPQDLLWTGSSFLEFQLWRQRYPGGLTGLEQSFAAAMYQKADKKRKNRQIAVVTIFVVLLLTVIVISNLWLKASRSRDSAVLQARRAEASMMIANGRALPDADPTTKLAYAIASLELADTPHGRRFALQAISENPATQVLEVGPNASVDLSPDRRWIAITRQDGSVDLLPRDGSATINVQKPHWPGTYVQWGSQFSPNSDLLIFTWRQDPSFIKVWSLSEKKIVQTFRFEGSTRCFIRANKAIFVSDTKTPADAPFSWGKSVIRTWYFDSNKPEITGQVDFNETYWRNIDIDRNGDWITYIKGKEIKIRSLKNSTIGPELSVGTHKEPIQFLQFHPNGKELASADFSGIRFWSLSPLQKNPVRAILQTKARPWFSPKGSFFLASSFNSNENEIRQWDLRDENKQPEMFRIMEPISNMIFDEQERWFAVGVGPNLAFYPLQGQGSNLLRFNGSATVARFTPNRKSVLIGSDYDGIRLINLPGERTLTRTLWKSEKQNEPVFEMHPSGKFVIVATTPDERVRLINIADGSETLLASLSSNAYQWITFSPDGKSAAGVSRDGIEVWDLASGRSRILKESKGKRQYSLAFRTNNALISTDNDAGQVFEWDISKDTTQILFKRNGFWVTGIATSRDGRYVAGVISSGKSFLDLVRSTSELVIYDSKTGKSSQIFSHGNRVFCVTFDPEATRVITGDIDGVVRVGPITGEIPHLLLGHSNKIKDIAVDLSGKWIASTEFDSFLRLWPMPKGKSPEATSHEEFLRYVRAQTNVRLIREKDSYNIQYQTSKNLLH
jgi:serine/threonine protein kinase/WD40 repeat protein